MHVNTWTHGLCTSGFIATRDTQNIDGIPKTPFRTLDADDVEHFNSTTYLNRDNIVPKVEFMMYQHVNFGHAHAIDRSIVCIPPFHFGLVVIPQSDLKFSSNP